ncbi:hypothetical protein UC34_24820 (plasmid) [Pandoraea vervacti]|uniref:Thiamine pyrophosphate-binding protein n=1 Tax=Pandoraea vervacti TaxID=656178 RepID=A0ABM5T583_9BURK|nr:thiamine pyrophosphate-binding protein [Pandoraea vervacti]AJP60141.1 hypothetical protein UC34_24820 [Pandoraea vervacti]
MNLARYILRALHQEGIDYFFMVPGKLINPFMSCYARDYCEAIQPVVAAFEGGAAMMADGYARASGRFGVAIMLDGPGVANAVGALANAFADGYPVLLLAGQIPQHYEMMGALQDSTQSGLNLAAVLAPLTRHSFHVRHVENGSRYLREVVKGMYAPDAAPAYLAIAKDVLLQEPVDTYRPIGETLKRPHIADVEAICAFVDMLEPDSRIAILAGGRANRPVVTTKLIALSERDQIPVAATVSSKGVFPETHPHYLGVYGYSGHRRALDTLLGDPPDVLILLGFDTTQWTTLVWERGIKPAKYLLQVGTKPSDLDFILQADGAIVADEEVFLDTLLQSNALAPMRQAGVLYIERSGKSPLFYDYDAVDDDKLHPADAITAIHAQFSERICVVDSGNHRSFATHYWLSPRAQCFFSANTICSMGWAIPASIGIHLARREPCVVITGDGCMLMHGTEIQTAVRYHADIVYIVFNNAYYGATYFNNRNNIAEMSQLPTHDWVKFAEAFGARAKRVSTLHELQKTLDEIRDQPGPFVIDLICSHLPDTPASEYKTRVRHAEVL